MACGHRMCRLCLPSEADIVRCPECLETTPMLKIRIDKGFDISMQTLLIICTLCDWSGPLSTYQNHLEQIHNQYKCLLCNEVFNLLLLLNEHMEKKCSQMLVYCTLQSYGCKKQLLRRNLPEHYLTLEHQLSLERVISQRRTPDIDEKIETASRSNPQTEEERTTISTASISDRHSTDQESVNEILSTLCGGMEVLTDDLGRLSSESLQQSQTVETISQRLPIIKTSCEETSASLNAFNTNTMVLQQQGASMKQKVQDMQYISYDGILVWRITNVQEKMNDAQSERQTSIYSPPFYSSSAGYKMCVRLYFLGDGNARRTHMSIFFVLMRSLHDSILKFPFNYKVIFCLFDLTGQQQHIIDSFWPDIRSNSFQRPQCEMNIASGIPKFVALSKIQQPNNPYIKEDTMFIKVMVDFDDLSKAILSYALSLNPGLPTHLQQKMIQQEIERRAQMQTQQRTHTELGNNERTTSRNSLISNQQEIDESNTTNK